jgi:hypothetical protein
MVAKNSTYQFSSNPPVTYWFPDVRDVGEVEGEKPD